MSNWIHCMVNIYTCLTFLLVTSCVPRLQWNLWITSLTVAAATSASPHFWRFLNNFPRGNGDIPVFSTHGAMRHWRRCGSVEFCWIGASHWASDGSWWWMALGTKAQGKASEAPGVEWRTVNRLVCWSMLKHETRLGQRFQELKVLKMWVRNMLQGRHVALAASRHI